MTMRIFTLPNRRPFLSFYIPFPPGKKRKRLNRRRHSESLGFPFCAQIFAIRIRRERRTTSEMWRRRRQQELKLFLFL